MSLLTEKKSSTTGLTYWSNDPPNPTRLVLYIAGWGCSGQDVQALAQVLSKAAPNHLYLAPDQPGHGDSSPSTCPDPSIAGFAQILHTLCKEVAPLILQDILVIGHSMGCRTALEFFSQTPAIVTGVVLLDGNWHGQKEVDRTPPPKGIWPVEAAKQGMQSSFGPHTPASFQERLLQLCETLDTDYLILAMLSNRVWDSERMVDVLQQLQKVDQEEHSVRLLLVQATDGASGPKKPMKKGEESVWMKTARLNAGEAYAGVVVEESGHWPHVDCTDEVAALMASLL